MRPIGKYKYTLILEEGNVLTNITSPLPLKPEDEICYLGNKLLVISVVGEFVTVRTLGFIIQVY